MTDNTAHPHPPGQNTQLAMFDEEPPSERPARRINFVTWLYVNTR